MQPADLSGRVALVTGGSRGIGNAVVRRFLACGARVAFTARRAEGLDSAASDLREAGFEDFLTAAAHSAREDEVRRAFDVALETFGRMDIVVNNAATNPVMAPLADIDLDVFDRILATNLRGYLVVAREGVRRMREMKAKGAAAGGSIVNISTVGAYRAMGGLGAYGVSKAAVNMLTRTLGAELAPEGIRVNGVAPGLVRTRFSEALWKDPRVEERALQGIPLGRLAEPDDLAGVVAFLASDDARYITGETIVVDGGLLAR